MNINDIKNKTLEPNSIETDKEKRKETAQELIANMNIKKSYEHSNISEYEIKQIVEILDKMDLEKDWHSKWSEWVIFKVRIQDEEGNFKEYIAAKKRYDNDPDNEWKIHKKVEDIIKEKMPDSIVKVPELKAVITLGSLEKFIIMEFVNGKTLYQLELEEIFKRWNIPTGEIQSDMEAEGLLFKMLNLNPMSKKDSEQTQKRYYQEMKMIKLFNPEQWKKFKDELKKFLQEMHKEWIFHRDGSNPRNIMIHEDGSLYVIDFWKSTWIKDGKINEKDIYEKQEGENMIGVYPRDEEILWEISWLTKDEEDMEIETFKEEQKQKVKSIQSDRSIFEYINEIPEAWMKNQKKAETMKKLIQKQSTNSKKISYYQMEEAKTKEELIVLILAQSKANIGEVINQIANRKKTLEEEIKKEKMKQVNVPGYLLQAKDAMGIQKHKEHYEKLIEKIQKKMEKVNKIEEYIRYLQEKLA